MEYRKTPRHIGDIVLRVNAEMLAVQPTSVPEACSTLTNLVYFAGEAKDEEGSSSDEQLDSENDDGLDDQPTELQVQGQYIGFQ